jgi:hypothetical protein
MDQVTRGDRHARGGGEEVVAHGARRARALAALGLATICVAWPAAGQRPLPPGATGWRDAGHGAVRGLTVGPIENTAFPGRGYGTEAFARGVAEAARLGATWLSITPTVASSTSLLPA